MGFKMDSHAGEVSAGRAWRKTGKRKQGVFLYLICLLFLIKVLLSKVGLPPQCAEKPTCGIIFEKRKALFGQPSKEAGSVM